MCFSRAHGRSTDQKKVGGLSSTGRSWIRQLEAEIRDALLLDVLLQVFLLANRQHGDQFDCQHRMEELMLLMLLILQEMPTTGSKLMSISSRRADNESNYWSSFHSRLVWL
jgi:hypothetical protein